ncbi:MAG TPA: hypothetical protein VNB90_00985 [Cytophagaceae bacterium]|nr:hypothetical protein [Cytophagaceae bacterium]
MPGRVALFFFVLFFAFKAKAQEPVPEQIILGEKVVDSAEARTERKEMDLPDVWRKVFKKKQPSVHRPDTTQSPKHRDLLISALPCVGYSLQTRFVVLGVVNGAFYTSKERKENISSVLVNLTYSQNRQILLPLQSNIWTRGNKYNLSTDWRYWKYPSTTYGLGDDTKLSDGYHIDYSYIRSYQTLLRSIARNIYVGLGYHLDYFWNLRELDPPANRQTDFQKYGLHRKVVASGVALNFKYDNRKNSINPDNGYYAHVLYRTNFTFLGSDNNWESLVIDLRKYNKLPFSSKNVLAFWSYIWLTTGGNPPYTMLPSTGTDLTNNTGRGYIQGRFRSKNMLYAETEYRFAITNNGLLGGVVFLNGESVTDNITNKLQRVYAGWGFGVRVKMNKYSKTNIAVDYGFGAGGSRGFFINLGEVF